MDIKIIYHCYGGSHSSVTAAGIHLGLLPRDRTASTDELLKLSHFDAFEELIHGHFRYMGRYGSEIVIYALGKKTLGRRVTLLLRKLAKIAGCVDWIYPVDTTAPINPLMVIGGFLSRRVRLVTIGRPLVIFGTKLAYQRLSKLVTSVESVLRKRKIVKKDNFNFNRAVFYVCPRIFRSALPLAGLHLNPDHDEEAILKWSIEQKFRGEVGEISLVGHDDGYDIYLVGAGDEPDIIERILREFCRLIEFPASHWVVVKAPNSIFMLFAKIFKLFRFWNGLYFYEKMAFQRMLNFYRREASRIKMSIKEGILD